MKAMKRTTSMKPQTNINLNLNQLTRIAFSAHSDDSRIGRSLARSYIYILSLSKRLSLANITIYQSRGLLVYSRCQKGCLFYIYINNDYVLSKTQLNFIFFYFLLLILILRMTVRSVPISQKICNVHK